MSGLAENTTYYYCAYLLVDGKYTYGVVRTFTTAKQDAGITPGQMVDLGLSVKWAGWNVGASRPEEFGGYYAWGELEEKDEYSQSNYQYYDNQYQQYIITLGINICGTKYDVARVNWGGNWRMPTTAEFNELVNNCEWTWIDYNGVQGQKVTGPNGNSIFLPAAGVYSNNSVDNIGVQGIYWSGQWANINSMAACLLFQNGTPTPFLCPNVRYSGCTVRPVSD